MRYYEFVSEARRNPEQNPKYSVFDQVEPYLDNDNAFISFTSIDKLGINPKSRYQTPIGIYSYPLVRSLEEYNLTDEVIKKYGFRNQFPFASEAPYFWIFESTDYNNLLILSKADYTEKDYLKDVKKLEEHYTNTAPEDVSASFDDFMDQAESNARVKTYAGYIWNVSRCAAAGWNANATRTNSVQWNKLFREVLGYTGAVDIDATGIIHPSEPLQAVFFSKSAITPLKRINNKTASMHAEFLELKDIEYAHDYMEWVYDITDVYDDFTPATLTKLAVPFMTEHLVFEILVSATTAPLVGVVIENIKNPETFFSLETLGEMAAIKKERVATYAVQFAMKKGIKGFGEFLERYYASIPERSVRETICTVIAAGNNEFSEVVNSLSEGVVARMIADKPSVISQVKNPTQTHIKLFKALGNS
jgi:hypothetical protein